MMAIPSGQPLPVKPCRSSGTSPNLPRITASENSPVIGLPVRENATAPPFSCATREARLSAALAL
jgi:hypothetical protein